jgi:hypothetical protein
MKLDVARKAFIRIRDMRFIDLLCVVVSALPSPPRGFGVGVGGRGCAEAGWLKSPPPTLPRSRTYTAHAPCPAPRPCTALVPVSTPLRSLRMRGPGWLFCTQHRSLTPRALAACPPQELH